MKKMLGAIVFAGMLFAGPAVVAAQTSGQTVTLGPVTPTATSVKIEGTITGSLSEPITLQYHPEGARTSATVNGTVSNGHFAIPIAGLTPATQYFFSISGAKFSTVSSSFSTLQANGTGTQSSTTTTTATTGTGSSTGTAPVFTSSQAISIAGSTYKAGVVTSFGATNVKQTTATITGTVTSTTAPIEVLLDKTGNGATFDTHTTPTIGSDKKFSFNLTNLTPGHSYSIVVVDIGRTTIRYTNVQTFRTLEISASAYVSDVTDTGATIWAQVSEGTQNLSVIYSTGASAPSTTKALAASSTNPGLYTLKLTGLTAATNYNYQIVGAANGNTITYTNVYSFSTASAGGVAGTVPTIQGAGNGSASLTTSTQGYNGGALVQCGLNGPLDGTPDNPTPGQQSCSFAEMIKLINRVLNFIIFIIAPIMMIYAMTHAGILYISSGGSAEQVGKARGMLSKAVIGMVLAMCGWLIVQFVFVQLGYNVFSAANPGGFPKFY